MCIIIIYCAIGYLYTYITFVYNIIECYFRHILRQFISQAFSLIVSLLCAYIVCSIQIIWINFVLHRYIYLIVLFSFLSFFHLLQNFREQCIDGSGLPLLTEDHLMNSLGMKLGPALKLRSVLMKKLGGPCPCMSCNSSGATSSTSAASTANILVNSVPNPADSPTGNNTRPGSTESGT